MKFGVQVEYVDKWCMTVCSVTRSKVKATSHRKSEIRPFSKASSPIYNGAGKWPRMLKLWHNT